MTIERQSDKNNGVERLARIYQRIADFQATNYAEFARNVLKFPLSPSFFKKAALRLRTGEMVRQDRKSDNIEIR